jgi:hypothetical protein
MKQDQMGLQATLSREARASSESMANASRAESARQFNASAGMQQGRMAEDARRFDASLGAQQENTAWERSQAEKKLAEDTRRFGIAQEASGRMEARQERQLTMEEFRNQLAENRDERAMAQGDVQMKMANAQLQQYLAATDEEKQTKANRERIAKGAFGSLIIAGRLNGGVIPTKALEIANQELGDKENQIVGGGYDENTGLAFFEMRNLKTGEPKQLRMTPENQYAAIHAGIGKQEADMFYDTFKTGSSIRAAMERRRIELQEAGDADMQKYAIRQQISAEDPIKRAEVLQKQAELARKKAAIDYDPTATEEQRDAFKRKAEAYEAQADSLLLPQQEKPKPFAITPAMQREYGIPPGSRVSPNPDGGYTVVWKENGKVRQADFAPGEW